jgi:hypothetical protein
MKVHGSDSRPITTFCTKDIVNCHSAILLITNGNASQVTVTSKPKKLLSGIARQRRRASLRINVWMKVILGPEQPVVATLPDEFVLFVGRNELDAYDIGDQLVSEYCTGGQPAITR